jgi:flagellar basal body P-ring formation protein FlgA
MRQLATSTVFAVLAFALLSLASAAEGQDVILRAQPQATGPAVTLGDIFENAGDVAGRAIAPAPKPGGFTTLSTRFLGAAASAAGLQWRAPDNVEAIVVTAAGAGVARVLPAAYAKPGDAAVIRRGDLVTLTYAAPGLQLSLKAKAMSDAAAGAAVRLVNPQSNKTIDAIAIGPGAATTGGAKPF